MGSSGISLMAAAVVGMRLVSRGEARIMEDDSAGTVHVSGSICVMQASANVDTQLPPGMLRGVRERSLSFQLSGSRNCRFLEYTPMSRKRCIPAGPGY